MGARVAVIGAGVAGLAAARELVGRGFETEVFEAADRPGGVLRSEREGGFLYEHAANGFLSGDPSGAVPLCRALELELAEAAPAAAKRWVFAKGALRELPRSPLAFAKSDLLSWRGKLALLGEPLARPQPSREESVAAFARRRFGREAERALVAPFVTGIFAGDTDALSLRAAFPFLAERDARGGMARSLAKDGLRHLARRALGESGEGRVGRSVLTAPIEGAEALPRALCAELGDRVQLKARIDKLKRPSEGIVLTSEGGECGPYAAAALALPAPAAAEISKAASGELATALRAIPHAPIAALHLAYRSSEIEDSLEGFGFLVAPGEAPAILGAVFESSILPRRAPEGSALVRVMIGGARRPELVELGDDALIALARRDLESILGIRAAPERARVTRWRRGIPQYTLGHEERVARADREAKKLGISLAGSAYRGVAVNKLVADGARVAAEVIDRLGALMLVPFAVAAAFAAAGCSAGQRAPESGDESASEAPSLRSYEVAEADGPLAEAGSIAISVKWLPPPPELIRSPGTNTCGAERRAPLRVHTMGGVQGAVASLADIGTGRAPEAAEPVVVAIEDCRAAPRVSLASRPGSPIDVLSRDENRREVALTYAAEVAGLDVSTRVGRFALPLVGQRVRIEDSRSGIYKTRTATSPEEPAYVVVPPHPYAAMTGEKGRAALEQVPPGRYDLEIWYPPLEASSEPLTRSVPVHVVAGDEAEVSVSLASAPEDRAEGDSEASERSASEGGDAG